MNDKNLHVEGTIVQIQQNTTNSSQVIKNIKFNNINKEIIDQILAYESDFVKLYGNENGQIFKELLLKLREDASKDLSGKRSILNRLENIAMGASSGVISAGILHLIGQIFR